MIIEIGMIFNLKCFYHHQLIKAHLEIMFNNNDGSDEIKKQQKKKQRSIQQKL